MRATISDFEHSLGRKLVLDPKVPLLRVRSGQVRVYRIKGRRVGVTQCVYKGATEHLVITEIRIAIVNCAACRRRTASRAKGLRGKERGVESRTWIGERATLLTAVENAVAAAQHQFVVLLRGEDRRGRRERSGPVDAAEDHGRHR